MASKKPKINDVTKTGPLSYRQLQAANLEAYAKASLVSPFANLARPQYASSKDFIYEGKEQSPILRLSGNKDYWGNSTWDVDTPNQADWDRLADARAENQPWYVQAINGIAKGAVLAGTTFIDGTVGLLTGIGQAIANGVSDDPNKHWYDGWDNPVTEAMYEIQLLSEEYLPNYRTLAEQEAPWYSWDNLTSANFIFDTVVKNMGFMVGAAYSGGVYTKAIDWAAKAIKLGMGFSKAASATIQAGLKAAEAARATRDIKALVGSFFNALAEAVQEALHSKHDFVTVLNQKLESKKFEQLNLAILEFAESGGIVNPDGTPDVVNSDPAAVATLNLKLIDIDKAAAEASKEITRLSENAGTMTGILNMLVLYPSDIAMFGRMYAGGWKAARTEHKVTTRATKEAVKEAKAAAKAGDPTKLNKLKEIVDRAERTGFQGLTLAEKALVEEVKPHRLGKKLGYFKAATQGPFREFNEEMLLGAASQASSYKYENEVDKIFNASLDPNAINETRSYIDSILKGLVSQYGDIDKYEEGFVGAITGFLGSPTFGRKNNATDLTWLGKSKWLGLTGGSVSDIINYRNKRRKTDEALRNATEVLRNENLASNIKHLIAQTKFLNDMNLAIIHDDEKEYKDARTASIFEMVSHLKRVNRLDLLQRAMQTTTEFTDEDVNSIAEMVTKLVSATTPDVQDKVNRRALVEKEIEAISNDIGNLLREATSDDFDIKYEAAWDALDEKKAELEALDSEIAKAKPATLSPYIKEDGKTPMTTEEIRQDLQKRVDNFDKIIKTITNAQEEIDSATSGQLTNELLDTLTWYKVMMKDWAERSLGITDKWGEVITRLASDPALVQAVESIKELDNLLEEAGISPKDAKIQFGGRLAQVKGIQNYANVLELLKEAVNKGGLELAYLLTSTQELPSGLTVGEYLTKLFENVLSGDTSMTKDIKDTFLKNLKDLKSMGEGHRKYNQLLEEYLSSPEKIDKAHQSSLNKAQSESNKASLVNTINGINWDASAGTITKLLKSNKAKIEEAGGFNEFIKNLSPQQKKKAKEVEKLLMGVDSLDSLIDDTSLDDDQSQILRGIIEDKLDDVDTIEQLANAIKDDIDSGKVDEEIRKLVPEDEDEEFILRLILAAEENLKEFVDDNLDDLINASEEAQRALDAEQDKIKEMADELKDDDEPGSDEAPEEKEPEEPKEDDIDEFDDDKDGSEDKETPTVNPTSAGEIKDFNKKASRSPIAGKPGHNRRRQISQFYLLGLDKETLPQHYQEHPEDIPKGVDPDAFLKYIKAVHKKLVDSGAYTYISGVNPEFRLKQGLEIRFTTDTELNEEAGVPVILMVVTNEKGLDLIIGSLPTSLDFQSILRGGTKTLAEVNPEDKGLYDTLCEELLNSSSNKKDLTISGVGRSIAIKTGIISEEESIGRIVHNSNDGLDGSKLSPLEAKYIRLNVKRILLDNNSTKEDLHNAVVSTAHHTKAALPELALLYKIQQAVQDGRLSVDEAMQIIEVMLDLEKDAVSQKKVSQIKTKVEALRSGHPSFSALNRSVSEVFGNLDIPITIMLNNGPRSSNAAKNPLLGEPIPGRVFVYVNSNTGAQIPLLCYSTNLKDLAPNDWYVDLTVAVILKLSDELNIGSIKSELLRWLPGLDNLHINIVVNAKTGAKSVLFGWGKTDDNKFAHSYSIKFQSDGTISDKDARAFFNTVANMKVTYSEGKRYPTTNVDRNRLNDKEYMSNISRYIKVNVTPNSTRTIDDWFEYEATPIQKKGKKPSTVNPAVPSSGKKGTSEVRTTSQGEVTVSAAGTVKSEDKELTKELKDEILNGSTEKKETPPAAPKVDDDALRRAFGDSETMDDDMPEFSGRRRRKRKKPEDTTPTESERMMSEYKENLKQLSEAQKEYEELAYRSINELRAILEDEIKSLSNDELKDKIKIYRNLIKSYREEGREISAKSLELKLDKYEKELNSRAKFSLASLIITQNEAINKETLKTLERVSAMFPKLAEQDRIVLVKGLIKVIDSKGNPRQAYGMFKNGVLYVSDLSPKGTAYHEAFHYVVDTLLSDAEYETMFKEAAKIYGNLELIELEEKLAESFREFMNARDDTSIKGRLKTIFAKLKHIIKSLVGRESHLDNLFWNIYRGKLQLETLDNYVQRNVTSEMLSIKDKAIANNTFMKAPNGNPTNLNERQWLQVRTKNFINWFGDWINDPANASKVVDENGEPLVVYHGGQIGITTFLNRADNPDYEKTKHQAGSLNRRYLSKDRVGIYFAKHKSTATAYSGAYSKKNRKVYEVFLNIRNPLELKFLTTVINRLINSIKKKDNRKLDPALVLKNQLDTVLQGHDGINHSKGTELIVFNSNQVKSATSNSGAFSTTDNTIEDLNYRQELLEYRSSKLAYDNLDQSTKNYLEARKISKEDYDALNIELKEILLQCM